MYVALNDRNQVNIEIPAVAGHLGGHNSFSTTDTITISLKLK